MQTSTPSSVWQRRTNRLIAAAVIVIGLTMMLSNITQCIYAGMFFILISLISLAYMTMKERELGVMRRPEDQPSPVLFLVTSHMLPRINTPTAVNVNDKPPSYDMILSEDGLPPDYSSILQEKPPRYEDLSCQHERNIVAMPGTSGSPFLSMINSKQNNMEKDHLQNIDTNNKSVSTEQVNRCNFIYDRAEKKSSSLPRHANPISVSRRFRKRNYSSNSNTNNAAAVHQTGSAALKTSSLLRLHVSSLSRDTADAGNAYLSGAYNENPPPVTDYQSQSPALSGTDHRNVQHNLENKELSQTVNSKTELIDSASSSTSQNATLAHDQSSMQSKAPL